MPNMTNKYYHPPDDGAKFKCNSCSNYFNCSEVIKIHNPKNLIRFGVTCVNCMGTDYFKSAIEIPFKEVFRKYH